MQIIADAKKYRLSNGQVITVEKISIRQYYLLVASLLVYQKALSNLIGLDEKMNLEEYFTYTKDHAIDLAKIKIEFENIKNILKSIVKDKIKKLGQKLVIEIVNQILEFNSLKLGLTGKEFRGLDELNEELEVRIGILSEMLNITPQEVMQLRNYDAGVLIREHNRNRVNMINDIRVAHHGEKDSYTKYTKGLMGEVVYTGNELLKNPGLLNKVVR